MRRFSYVLALLLVGTAATAQTPSFKIGWDQPNPISAVSAYQYTLKVDSGAATLITPTCVANPANTAGASKCTAPLATLTSGPHTLVLTAFNGFGSASSNPLSGQPPAQPINVSVTVTVTVP